MFSWYIKGQSYTRLNISMAWLREGARSSRKCPLAPRADRIDHLLLLGEYFLRFYVHSDDWLVRRIDTTELENDLDLSERTSLTLDGPIIAKIRTLSNIHPDSPLHIPLPATKKRLLGKFDVRVGDTSVPVLSSRDNSNVAVGVMVRYLVDHGVNRDLISDNLLDLLDQVALCHVDDTFYLAVSQILKIIDCSPNKDHADTDVEAEIETWKRFNNFLKITQPMRDDDFREFLRMLADFLTNFIPIAVVSAEYVVSEFIIKTHTVRSQVKFEAAKNRRQTVGYLSHLWLGVRLPIAVLRLWQMAFRVLQRAILRNMSEGYRIARMSGVRRRAQNTISRDGRKQLSVYLERKRILSLSACSAYTNSWRQVRRAVRLRRIIRGRQSPWVAHRIDAYMFEYYAWFQPILRIPNISGIFELTSRDTNLGRYGNQHFRITIPDGAIALDATIRVESEPVVKSEPPVRFAIEAKAVHNWVAIHATNYDRRQLLTVRSIVQIAPRSLSFLTQSYYAALLTAILFTIGLLSEIIGQIGGGPADSYGMGALTSKSSESIVTVLMVAPSIYTVILLRQDEHGLVALLLQNVRKVVGVCAVLSGSVAIPLALDLSPSMVLAWWTLGWMSALFALWHLMATRHLYRIRSTGEQLADKMLG
ncbi:hypothetical protein [Mycobacteroides chelonae]|uniref:hypothetical protein n=1 Tax=Mycobacteroides chelonae TaxID=1774 RepID=UPI0018B063CC|nr:hypothetical protein [Mycobacteroides chelonae]MBF9328446.1 hypothetical protein [Mycobacteroides chelonae]MBF9422624.1 hypothetical protein [Mycobacteroides chelonae]